jgi:AcrR family transcriptional regulator
MTATDPPPRRSDATRTAILAAARERFAADGYEKATIRAIAADAGIDPAMVMRYYGNKERLFAAAAEFDLRLPDVTAMPRTQVGIRIVGHFLNRWEEDETLMALLRAAVTNEAARDRLKAIFADQVAPAVAALSADPTQAPIRAGLLAAQMLGMAMCRYVLKLPPIVTMTRADVIAWLAPTVQRYLTADHP